METIDINPTKFYLHPLLWLESHALSIDNRLHVYYMIKRPVLMYDAPAWQHVAYTHLKKFQTVQNRAAEFISAHS